MQTIAPLSSLPAITNPVLIDGFSQPGYAGTPLIELSGSQAGSGDGLTITGADVTVRGLDIDNFCQGAGIHITGTGATGDWIYGNFLGTDPTGTQAEPNDDGVEIDGGASDNLIGTNGDGVNDAAERNLISGQPVRWRLDQRPRHGWQCRRGQLHRHECHRRRRPGQRHLARSIYSQDAYIGGGVVIQAAPPATGSAPMATASMTPASGTSSRAATTTGSTSSAPAPTATSSRATSSGPT